MALAKLAGEAIDRGGVLPQAGLGHLDDRYAAIGTAQQGRFMNGSTKCPYLIGFTFNGGAERANLIGKARLFDHGNSRFDVLIVIALNTEGTGQTLNL